MATKATPAPAKKAAVKTTAVKVAPAKAAVVKTPVKAEKPSAKEGKIITREALLKMPEKDYMNAAQLAYFRAELEKMRQEILISAGETTEHLRENEVVPDPADRATIEEEHALELRTRDRERKLLKKIAQSIEMIDTKEYGWCEETGDAIGLPRLLARPTANLTLEAQQRRELRQKRFGD